MKKSALIVITCLMLFAKVVVAVNTNSLDLEASSSQYAFITDANQKGLDITGNISVEEWVKFRSLTASNMVLVSKYTSGGQGSYEFYIVGSKLYFAYLDNGSWSLHDTYGFTNNVIIDSGSLNTWMHLAVTVNASSKTIIFYKNGSPISSTTPDTYASSMYNSTANFTIGASSYTGGYLDGLIDDVRVWNVVRTSSEIAANYQKELVGNEAGLVGYWKMNGSTADSTANANNLTPSGSPAYSTDIPFTTTTPPPPPPPPAATCSITGNVLDITSIADMNANGYPENVMLGLNSTGIPTVCIADAVTEDFLKAIIFFTTGWTPKSVYIVPDSSTPKDNFQDVSVLATSGTQNKIQIRHSGSNPGTLIKEITLP